VVGPGREQRWDQAVCRGGTREKRWDQEGFKGRGFHVFIIDNALILLNTTVHVV
jgi:hypothetical protein